LTLFLYDKNNNRFIIIIYIEYIKNKINQKKKKKVEINKIVYKIKLFIKKEKKFDQ
jgi:hypothetical protein